MQEQVQEQVRAVHFEHVLEASMGFKRQVALVTLGARCAPRAGVR